MPRRHREEERAPKKRVDRKKPRLFKETNKPVVNPAIVIKLVVPYPAININTSPDLLRLPVRYGVSTRPPPHL